MSKDQANTSGVSGDKEMEEAVKKVNENTDYKVLTREEYDKLLSLAHKNVLPSTPAPSAPAPSAPAPVSRLAGLLGPLRESTPHGGAKPKFTMRNPLVTPPPFHSMQNALNESQLHNTSFIPQSYNFPKLPIFSGSQEPQKGEVTFEVWSFEVRCLKNGQAIPEHTLLQSIRNSLRGSARDMLIPLGEHATVQQILDKLEGFYGIVSSGSTLMQTFYSDFQKDSEPISSYGARLEQTLTKAINYGHLDITQKDSMLRSKFWTGLCSQQLKNSTRHLYDASTSFESLLSNIRKVETEYASCSRPPQKQKAQQQSTQADKDQSKEDKILPQLTELMKKMTAMEKEMEKQKEAIASLNQSLTHEQSEYKPRGRGYGDNSKRGGYGRGRGFQNQNDYSGGSSGNYSGGSSGNENSRGSFRGGRSKGGYRGGTGGRGANRGNSYRTDNQPLN